MRSRGTRGEWRHNVSLIWLVEQTSLNWTLVLLDRQGHISYRIYMSPLRQQNAHYPVISQDTAVSEVFGSRPNIMFSVLKAVCWTFLCLGTDRSLSIDVKIGHLGSFVDQPIWGPAIDIAIERARGASLLQGVNITWVWASWVKHKKMTIGLIYVGFPSQFV